MTIFKKITTLFVMGAAALTMSLTSCQQSDNGMFPNDEAGYSVEYALSTPDGAASTIINTEVLSGPFDHKPPMGDLRKDNLGRILPCLNLTAEQKAAIKPLIKSYNDCVHTALDSLRASEKVILAPYNAERKAVLDSLKAGLLDRTQAGTRLKEIGALAKAALEANPLRALALEQMKACKDTLNAAVRVLLTDEQKVIWDNWVLTGEGCGKGPGRGRKP